jgi:hypothetical protein
MDGHDVARFQFDHIYNVPEHLGRYLIVAGYGELAIRSKDRAHDGSRRARKGRRK